MYTSEHVILQNEQLENLGNLYSINCSLDGIETTYLKLCVDLSWSFMFDTPRPWSMAEQGWYLPRMSRATWSTRRSQAGDETKITRSNGKQGAEIFDKDLQGERASALPLHYELHRVPTCSNTMERRRWNFVRGCNTQQHWQLRFAKQSCIQFPNNGSTCVATRIRCIDATISLGPIGNHQCVQPLRCQTAKDEASVKKKKLATWNPSFRAR